MAECSELNDGERSSDEDIGLDPRVKTELEALNSAAESINKLENELQKAKLKFRKVKADSSHRLGSLYRKIGKKWVLKARPYYELLRQSQKGQVEAQKTTAKFQRANGIYKAAKETVTLAEERLFAGSSEGKITFDSTWQDVLNHATAKFMDAEKEKTLCDIEHQTKAAEYNAIQQRIAFMLKDIPRTINRAKQFYELKDRLENRLHAERQNAEDLQLALVCSKQKYRMALISLEAISDEVHLQRKLRSPRLDLPVRTPGVGAELDSDLESELSDMPSATLDFMSETGSQVSWDDFSDSRCVSPALSVDFDVNDSSWVDSASSPESAVPTPDQPVSSIWSRFGSGISRITQEIGKIPSVSALSRDQSQGMLPREDVLEGAECDVKPEGNDDGYSSGWSLPESFRSLSHPEIGQSANLDIKKLNKNADIGNWIATKKIVAYHSSDTVAAESDLRHVEKIPAAAEQLEKSTAGDKELKSVSSAVNALCLEDTGKKTSVAGADPVLCSPVLNHSHSSAFGRPFHSSGTIALDSSNTAVSLGNLPAVSPDRLTAKPPLPHIQRASSLSPRNPVAAKSRPLELKPRRLIPQGSDVASTTLELPVEPQHDARPDKQSYSMDENVVKVETGSTTAKTHYNYDGSPEKQEIFV